MVLLALVDPNGIPAVLVTSQAIRRYLAHHRDPQLEIVDQTLAVTPWPVWCG